MVTIRDLMNDPQLFGETFAGDTWNAWRALLSGFYGLPLTDKEADTFKQLTGRDSLPDAPHDELWLVVGRRGGKTNISALLAIYEALFNNHKEKLAPGEIATVMLIAADRKQARSAFRYISGLLNGNPMLKSLIIREDKESIELSNRCAIEVGTASFRSVRGYSVPCIIADEIAFWRSEDSANPDFEVLNALRPAMATLNGKLIALSSPYSRRGALWEHYKRYFAQDDKEILVAQAPSRTMNPALSEKLIEKAMQRDPSAAKAEYLAQFRTDIETFISRESIENCTVPNRLELPPINGVNYSAFTDPSGGSKDAWTLAITHRENETVVLDAVRSVKPPFSPDAVVKDFAELLHLYRIKSVTGDRYGGEFPRELFRNSGIEYLISDRPRSDLYRDTLPLINSCRVELLDLPDIINQFTTLERKTSRGGRDSIDHAPGAHDDLVNSIAGAIINTKKSRGYDLAALNEW
ncbi:hypothetical protein [Thiomicrospira cyclica]|uniref:Terminase n=1 Tax=Thiomicrospira cyclica (strain DSM 14477 / JCM 11371 / ALM1) TaxID=717773 RepID=F6DCG0_THICA|nr:hypothetical protein [Thiomicrospira cyclica]AEG31546.1 hypothetical protein Thicy_0774 [Thiomicrospira cyclica ALM1]